MIPLNSPETIAAASQANAEALLKMTNSSIARAERLTNLNLNTLRSLLDESLNCTQQLLSTRDPAALSALQRELSRPILEKLAEHAREVSAIVTEGQQEVSKLLDSQMIELNKQLIVQLDQAAKSAPAGSENLFGMVKSAVSASSDAYAKLNDAVKEISEFAESNLKAAGDAALKSMQVSRAA